jgi:hypothetical protein
MAITPCRECGHQVSDQAAMCPSCGVPIAPPVKTKSRATRPIANTLIALMVAWTIGTLLWLLLPSGAPNALMTQAKLLLQPAKRAAVASPPAVVSTPTQSTLAPRPDKGGPPAAMLAENQHALAAEPYKTQLFQGDAVDVRCDQVNQSGSVLQGSGCNLAFVDPRSREVNLALILANESGAARVYVVGPMTETDCQMRGDEISGRLLGSQRGEHLVWKNCAESARQNMMPGGCNLDSPSIPLPEVPAAHLWRYECGSSNVARTSSPQTAPHRSRSNRSRAKDATPATAEPAVNTMTTTASTPSANNIRLASADGAYVGGATTITRIPPEEASVAHASHTTSVQPSATTPDDLARVRAKDPAAADHIATYCSKTAPLSNRDALMADCRRSEAEAWTRLVLQNEFPTLDEATRKKCSAAPFPDTYVAKESCARYSLRAN